MGKHRVDWLSVGIGASLIAGAGAYALAHKRQAQAASAPKFSGEDNWLSPSTWPKEIQTTALIMGGLGVASVIGLTAFHLHERRA